LIEPALLTLNVNELADKEVATLAGMELGSDFIPFDVYVETMLGVVFATFGAILNAGKFLPIDGSLLYNSA